MAGSMLSPEQEQEFMRQLESNAGADTPVSENEVLSPEQQTAAMQAGAEMAAADTQEQAADTASESADELARLGFGSVDDLIAAYKQAIKGADEMKEMLSQLTAIAQAVGNDEELDPSDPQAQTKKAVREELKPLYDKMRVDARNKVVQDSWGKFARENKDVEELMPEIREHLALHADYAAQEDGLQRAYNEVRSKKYRSEESLLSDPEFIKRAASNEKVRNAVLEEHLKSVAKNGDVVPETITEGGGIPMSGKKDAPNKMEQAKRSLAAMLGMK